MTRNPSEADDLTQDVFIQVFRKLRTFRGESALSTWLHRVAVTTALMHFRKRDLRQVSLDGPVENGDGSATKWEPGHYDDRLREAIDRIAIIRALETLPSGYRTVFELHEIQGYGHREIACILCCSVGNSKSQLHKAKQRMRECLTQQLQQNRDSREACRSAVMRENNVSRAKSAGLRLGRNLAVRRAVRKLIMQKVGSASILQPKMKYLEMVA